MPARCNAWWPDCANSAGQTTTDHAYATVSMRALSQRVMPVLCYFPPGRATTDHACAQVISRAAAADPSVHNVMNDARALKTRVCNGRARACCERAKGRRQLASSNILASGVVFARPGCCGVVQGVVSGFLTGRWLLPFSSSKKAGSHNLSIYPCVLTCVGSNPRKLSGDSLLTLPPMLQAKTASCAAIAAPWAA